MEKSSNDPEPINRFNKALVNLELYSWYKGYNNIHVICTSMNHMIND